MEYLFLLVILGMLFVFLLITKKLRATENKSLYTAFVIISVINLLALPLALFIGGMATDSPDSTFFNFLMGFFFIQGLPLLSYLLLFLFRKKKSIV